MREVVDGDRSLRVRVEPPHRLLVLGLLGEPFLRFGPNGVWVNRALAECGRRTSSRAAAPAGFGSTKEPSLLWHDHRLSPPASLRAGESAAWSLPLALDGRRTELTGSFTRVARPPVWPWLVAGIVALGSARGVRARSAAPPAGDSLRQ